MLIAPKPSENSPADEWAIRSEKWLSEARKLSKRRKVRERQSEALILCGHGMSMRVEDGTLVIREGFTHYPQKPVTHRFFPGDLKLPTRILLLDGSGTLSFDVMTWLIEQGVTMIRITWDGRSIPLIGTNAFPFASDKVALQDKLRANPHARVRFAADLIAEKLRRSIDVLGAHFPTDAAERAINQAHQGIAELRTLNTDDMQAVRAIEGGCATKYFYAWRALEIAWVGEKRHPVPDAWKKFWSRSSILTSDRPTNSRATHPVNALLNYAYAVKISLLQVQLIIQGYDPSRGVMHHAREGHAAFAYDMIEPERPLVDGLVLGFIAKQKFSAHDFVLRKDGTCRLSPQLAKVLAKIVSSGKPQGK